MIDLEPAAQEMIRLVNGVTDDQLTNPTPCADTSVAKLLDHIMGLCLAFTRAAEKTTPADGGPPPSSSAEHLDPDWRTLLPQRLHDLAHAWHNPGAWEGMAAAGGVHMPAAQMGLVAVDEIVLHGWDLARATGQDLRGDPAATEAVLAFTAATAQPGQEAARQGLFGPVVPVPADAASLDRALGFAGRDPSWSLPSPAS